MTDHIEDPPEYTRIVLIGGGEFIVQGTYREVEQQVNVALDRGRGWLAVQPANAADDDEVLLRASSVAYLRAYVPVEPFVHVVP